MCRVLVLPEPAPAMTRSGAPACSPCPEAMFNGPALFGVQGLKVGGGHRRTHWVAEQSGGIPQNLDSPLHSAFTPTHPARYKA